MNLVTAAAFGSATCWKREQGVNVTSKSVS
jgi:hypothetical protein